MSHRAPLAELIGTFLLTLGVILSVNAGAGSALATAVIAAFTLMICVYTIGNISGSHINPAVTLSLLSGGKISSQNALIYIICQILGAILAVVVAGLLTGNAMAFSVSGNFDMAIFFTELIGALFFLFGISAVVWGKVNDAFHGFVVGGSLLLGIMLSAHAGGLGILNPAVALGVGAFNLATIAGPIIGGILGVILYRSLID
jgi:glycerol uptake facilitator-like aquaporin